MAILTAKKMSKRFGGLIAVDGLDLEIKEHSIHSVIGPNGAGKTTFFNCVTGFYRPEVGEILFTTLPSWAFCLTGSSGSELPEPIRTFVSFPI